MESGGGLTQRDLSALSAFELGLELNEIDRESARLTEAAVDAQRALAKAEARSILTPEDLDARVQVKIQKAAFTVAKLQLSQLSKRQSRVQTILRTIGTV